MNMLFQRLLQLPQFEMEPECYDLSLYVPLCFVYWHDSLSILHKDIKYQDHMVFPNHIQTLLQSNRQNLLSLVFLPISQVQCLYPKSFCP